MMGFLTFSDRFLYSLYIFHFSLFSPAKSRGLTGDTVASSDHLLPFRKIKIQRLILSISLGVVTGFTAALLCACLIRSLVRYLNRIPILKGPVIFSPKINPKALQNETQLLDSTPINGKYYRIVLDNGLTFAAKKLELIDYSAAEGEGQSKSGKRAMQRQLALLGNLKHRNLMSLRGYVNVGEMERCWLIYDYMVTGNLEDAMMSSELKWEVRLQIAIGILKGLKYLHFECDPQILHSNLKPTNVMLNSEFEPMLTDFGLANLLVPRRQTSSYTAPECVDSSRYSEKSDIYSFGMILGVLLTGKAPTELLLYGGGENLGEWLQQLAELREVVDENIMGEGKEVAEDEILLALRIAGVCISDLPEDRPSSDELLLMFTQLHCF